ncbi:MAG: tetratricopeptide repeat protein [Candidatus Rifleibacteriota bacterium]
MNIEAILKKYFWVILALTTLATVGLSLHLYREAPFAEKELLFVPDARYVKRICGTFRNPVALAFYMKGAQELAYATHEKFELLQALFKLAIELDPKLTQAAFLGGMVAPTRAKDVLKANKLLKLAHSKNPDNWQFPYWIGFNYLQVGKYKEAAEYYRKASKLPGALPFLETASVYILSKANNLDLAVSEAERLLAGSKEEDTNELLLLRLKWLKTMQFLEGECREYKKKTGEYPQKLEELVEAGLLKELPQDEFGEGFYLVHPGDPDKGYMVRSNF